VNRHRLLKTGVLWFLLSPFTFAQDLVINEVLYDPIGVNTGRQVVEIRNRGTAALDLGTPGYWLRFPPAAWRFPSGTTIPPGDLLLIHINRAGTSTPQQVFTGTSGLRNLGGADSLAIYRTNLFQDPSQLVHFVQWGAGGRGGEEVAVAAGLWTAGSFVDVSALNPGSTIAYQGPGTAASDWCIDGTPTLGQPNDACTPSFIQSGIRLEEVGYTGMPGAEHVFVEIRNRGSVLEDIGGYWIVQDGAPGYRFPSATLLAPGELALVHLGIEGTNRAFEFFSGSGPRELRAADALSLHGGEPFTDAGKLVDFVQWGSPGSLLEAQAVQAGIWGGGEFVDAADRRALGALASRLQAGEIDGEGSRLGRWLVDNTPTPGLRNGAPPAPPAIVINEVLLDPPGPNSGQQVVELHNRQQTPVDIGGYTICMERLFPAGRAQCYSLPPGISLPAGGFFLIRLNRSGKSAFDEISTGPFRDLVTDRDELALFCTPTISNPNNFIGYLSWGSGRPFFFGELAASVGIWPADGSVDVTALRDGSSLAYLGSGNGPLSYRIDLSPSLGRGNEEGPAHLPFRRGDCSDDGQVDITDAITIFQFLFLGRRRPFCMDACDTNDDSVLDISDPVYLLEFLFRGGPRPPLPGPGATCGGDPSSDNLTCDSFVSC
jgi:hypothetical protein